MAGNVSRPAAPWLARFLFAGGCMAASALWLPWMAPRFRPVFGLAALAIGLVLERALAVARPARAAGSLAGLFVGAGAGAALLVLIPNVGPTRAFAPFVVVVLAFLGAVSGGRAAEALVGPATEPPGRSGSKLVDTSAIIDGRLADVVAVGFLEGRLVVPGFILRELQRVADSVDPRHRARGRRGLEVLERLKAEPGVLVEFPEIESAEGGEVDDRLVRAAERAGAALVTTDYNLNKVASLRGVRVINVNDLAHALRPVLLPGERLEVEIVREGKEPEQGLAYLDDGTMIVVESARGAIGRAITVEVVSVLQTGAGKMFFARPVTAPAPPQNG